MAEVLKALDGLANDPTPKVIEGRIRGAQYFYTLKAMVGIKYDRFDAGREAFAKLNGKYDRDAVRKFYSKKSNSFNASYEFYYAQAYIDDPQVKPLIQRLLRLKGDRYEDRKDHYDDIAKIGEEYFAQHTDHPSAPFFKALYQPIMDERDYMEGKQVTVPIEPDLSTFLFDDIEKIEYVPDGKIKIDNQIGDYRYSMTSFSSFPGLGKEVEFDIEFPELADTDPSANQLAAGFSACRVRNEQFYFGLTRIYRRNKPQNVHDIGYLMFGYTKRQQSMFFYQFPILPDKNTLRVISGSGYFEIYVNDQFVTRSMMHAIEGAYSQLMFEAPTVLKGRGHFQISNVRVTIQPHMPPINETDEHMIAYYKFRLDRFPEDKWSVYWMATTHHRAGDYAKALEMYQQAIDMGIDQSRAAFFIGDCHEQTGQLKEALKWYQIAALPENQNLIALYDRGPEYPFSNFNNWAAFRLQWLKHTHSNEEIRRLAGSQPTVDPIPSQSQLWAIPLINAVKDAEEGRFDVAEQLVRQSASKTPVAMEEVVRTMLQSYGKKIVYRQSAEEPPIYQRFEKPIPFFELFESFLDTWGNTY